MIVVAAVLAAVAVMVRPVRGRVRDRVAALLPEARVDESRPAAAQPPSSALRPRVLLLGVAGVVLLVVTGWSSWTLPVLAVGLFATARSRRTPPAATELPLVIDLLSASLRGGALLPAALEVAAGATGQQLRDRLLAVARNLRTGGDVVDAFAELDGEADLVAVARICTRTGGTGAASADELERLARRLRTRRRSELDARTARASVWVVLPLCLCFLPAFVLVGVVPLAVSLLATVR